MNTRKYVWFMIMATILIVAGCSVNGKDAPAEEKADGENSGIEKELNEEGESVIEDHKYLIKAIYIGRVDPSSIEILYEGEFSTYMLHQDQEQAMQAGEIESYSAVDLQYVEGKDGKKQILSIEKADPPGVGNAPEMTYQGRVRELFGDSVCMIDGEPFFLAYELMHTSSDSAEKVEKEDYIYFDYYKDTYGRKVITSFEKRFTDTGRFDNVQGNMIFIQLSGNPNEIKASAYALTPEIMEMITKLELDKGEELGFDYIVGQSGLKTIVSLEKIDQ